MDSLLDIINLRIEFNMEQGILRAVDNFNLTINKGESIGIVGESGCGKSVTALSTLLLLPQPEGKITKGKINYYRNNKIYLDIASLKYTGQKIREIRGNEISMIFQEPMTSLNPVYTIGQQIVEAIILHQKVNKKEAKDIALRMLEKVKMPAAEKNFSEYPHRLSGGMRQRAMIAMALSCKPALLIADEPTTALDVTIEAQILSLIKDLQKKFDMALMMITHDLGVIAETVDKVIVMYVGRIVEKASVEELFKNPLHPYTKALFKSLPKIGSKKRLSSIEGLVPSPYLLPGGCPFKERCSEAFEYCNKKKPPKSVISENHYVYCWKFHN